MAPAPQRRIDVDPPPRVVGDRETDGRPYPALAQFATREARQLARNVVAVLHGRAPTPFRFRSLGTMAALGHTSAVAEVMGVRLTGFPAWWFRRTYYLFQMPRWDRRLRMVLDWTVALLFRPDVTKVDLAPVTAGGSLQRVDGPTTEAPDLVSMRGAAPV